MYVRAGPPQKWIKMQNRDRTRRKGERGRSDNAGSWRWTKKCTVPRKLPKMQIELQKKCKKCNESVRMRKKLEREGEVIILEVGGGQRTCLMERTLRALRLSCRRKIRRHFLFFALPSSPLEIGCVCVSFLVLTGHRTWLMSPTSLDVVTKEQEHIEYIGGMNKGGGAGERVR